LTNTFKLSLLPTVDVKIAGTGINLIFEVVNIFCETGVNIFELFNLLVRARKCF
jgi:hypothetical protein